MIKKELITKEKRQRPITFHVKQEEFLAMSKEERAAYIARVIDIRRDRINRASNQKAAARALEKVNRKQNLTVSEFEALTGCMFSHNMTGKMLNILSLSSNVFMNERCISRLLSGKGICAECFAATLQMQYDDTFINTAYNSLYLSSKIIPLELIPVIDADELRIESFGDVRNWIQAANYFQFAYKNENIPVTAWTKNPDFYDEAVKHGFNKPKNFTLILSSFNLNERVEIPEKYRYIIDKTFTVYTLDWLLDNGLDYRFINCGARSCKHCQKCYGRAYCSGDDIRELLKADASKAAKIWPEFNIDTPLQDTTSLDFSMFRV